MGASAKSCRQEIFTEKEKKERPQDPHGLNRIEEISKERRRMTDPFTNRKRFLGLVCSCNHVRSEESLESTCRYGLRTIGETSLPNLEKCLVFHVYRTFAWALSAQRA
jgi:hypothetical protein